MLITCVLLKLFICNHYLRTWISLCDLFIATTTWIHYHNDLCLVGTFWATWGSPRSFHPMGTWGVGRLDLGVEKYPWCKHDRKVPEHHPHSEFLLVSVICYFTSQSSIPDWGPKIFGYVVTNVCEKDVLGGGNSKYFLIFHPEP